MRVIPFCLLLALGACGGGAEIGEPDNGSIYSAEPNVAECNAGSLKTSEKQKALDKLNQIRALHGLPGVDYDTSADAEVAAAALMMVANNALTHAPQTTDPCYSSTGLAGAQTSNLYMMSGNNTLSTDSGMPVEAFLTDSGVSSLGHRRWLLDPFLASTAFGRVDGTPQVSSTKAMAAALKVIGGGAANLTGTTFDYVAFPAGNYPSSLVDKSWFLSFSVVADRLVKANNNGSHVDYSEANVEMFDGALNSMTVSSVSANYENYGLPNHLQWKVSGLANNTLYTVKINNVRVDNVLMGYQYTFTLTQ